MLLQQLEKYKNAYIQGKSENRADMDVLYDSIFVKEKELFELQAFVDCGNCNAIVLDKRGVYGCFAGFSDSEVKMYLDPIDKAAVSNQLLIQGFYEPEEMTVLKKCLRLIDENPVVFDIGANLGWYGINVGELLPNSEIYFFEPVPETVARLKQNLILNEIDLSRVCPYGLYNRNMTSKFYYDVVASGASSLANLKERDTTQVIDVELKRMDDVISEFGIDRLDFIKMDVEGAELFALQGAEKTLKLYLPIIFTEMLRKWAKKQGYHPNDIIEYLGTLGYECYVISGDKLRRFYKVTEDTIETNYFFMHEEKHAAIISEMTENNKDTHI